MRHTTTLPAIILLLALTSCSSGNDKPEKTVTATVTASPSLSDAEAKQACADAWLAVLTADGYDPDAEPETPGECDGLPGQADMYAEALAARNQANRDELDGCLDDPSCTAWPTP